MGFSAFLTGVPFAKSLATSNPVINEALFALIKSKIHGEVFDLIVANNPETWASCKLFLIKRYSDPISEELLFNKLSTHYQQINQIYEKYTNEVKHRLNKMKNHIQLNNQDASIIKGGSQSRARKNGYIS